MRLNLMRLNSIPSTMGALSAHGGTLAFGSQGKSFSIEPSSIRKPVKRTFTWRSRFLPLLALLPAALLSPGCSGPSVSPVKNGPVMTKSSPSAEAAPTLTESPAPKVSSFPLSEASTPTTLKSTSASVTSRTYLSSTDLVRQRIHLNPELGYTGRNVRIGILDLNQPGKRDVPTAVHAASMEDIITGKGKGLAPEAKVSFYGFTRAKGTDGSIFPKIASRQMPDTYAGFELYVGEVSAAFPNAICEQFDKILAETAQRPNILNLSLNESRMTLAEHLILDLESHNGTTYNYANLRQIIYGPDALRLSQDQKMEVLLGHLEHIQLKDQRENGVFIQSIGRYQKKAEQLSKAGIVVVVSSGNDMSKYPTVRANSLTDRVNVLSLSHDVIVVGASDTMGTPADPYDDRMAPFSNHGQVNLAAPGVNIPLNNSTVQQILFNGTSASAAHVSAVIALMREANPRLSVADIRRILFITASPLADATRGKAGHGIVQEELAVWRAKADSIR